MRLFINLNKFISVLFVSIEEGFSCQMMQLIHGVGLYPATCMDAPGSVVSAIVHGGDNKRICKNIEEVFKFHQELLELEAAVEVFT